MMDQVGLPCFGSRVVADWFMGTKINLLYEMSYCHASFNSTLLPFGSGW